MKRRGWDEEGLELHSGASYLKGSGPELGVSESALGRLRFTISVLALMWHASQYLLVTGLPG